MRKIVKQIIIYDDGDVEVFDLRPLQGLQVDAHCEEIVDEPAAPEIKTQYEKYVEAEDSIGAKADKSWWSNNPGPKPGRRVARWNVEYPSLSAAAKAVGAHRQRIKVACDLCTAGWRWV